MKLKSSAKRKRDREPIYVVEECEKEQKRKLGLREKL